MIVACFARPLRSWAPVVAAAAVAGCPKTVELRPAGLVVVNRTPTQCTRLERTYGGPSVEASEPQGCNASVRFALEPSGSRDVDLPFFRDSDKPTTTAPATGGRPRGRTVVLRDPGGQRAWSVEVDEDALPWSDQGRCARGADPARFDYDAWRFLVLRVRTVDELGTSRPLVEAQEDTIALRLRALHGGESLRTARVASTTHPGVWAVAWCSEATPGPYRVEVDVRGAYQLKTDTFVLPDISRDTYTVLDYVMEPIAGEGELP